MMATTFIALRTTPLLATSGGHDMIIPARHSRSSLCFDGGGCPKNNNVDTRFTADG